MSQKWLDATRRYRQAQAEREKKKTENLLEQEIRVDDSTWRIQAAGIADAARDLEQFLNSQEGQSAMELLAAAKQYIVFGEESGGGYANVAFIDGHGLQRSIEPSGIWTTHAKRQELLEQTRISPITAREAIQAAVWNTTKKPYEVLSWLRRELDNIANAAK